MSSAAHRHRAQIPVQASKVVQPCPVQLTDTELRYLYRHLRQSIQWFILNKMLCIITCTLRLKLVLVHLDKNKYSSDMVRNV